MAQLKYVALRLQLRPDEMGIGPVFAVPKVLKRTA